jgi:hypothetical protein
MKRLLSLAILALTVLSFTSCVNASTGTTVAGQSVTIFVKSCSGTVPFTFQWQKNGANIAGATGVAIPAGVTGVAGSAYVINSAAVSDAGVYTCVVSNAASSTTSDTATLSFLTGPSGAITGVVVNGVLQP